MSKMIPLSRLLVQIKDGTHGTHERVEKGVPLLSAKNVFNDKVVIDDDESLIGESEAAAIVANGFPAKDDILLTTVGTIGRSFVWNKDIAMPFQRSVSFIRLNKKQNPRYFKYYFETDFFQDQLKLLTKTSAQPGVYMGDVRKILTPVTDRDSQDRAVKIIDDKTSIIDKMIGAKNHTHTQLAELRTAIIAEAMRGGVAMSAPKVRLKTIASVLNGATPKSDNPDYWDGPIYWATPVDLSKLNSKFIESTQRKITETGYASCNTTLIEPGNIVLSNRAPIGLVAINKVPLCTNQGCKVLVLDKRKVDPTYLYYYLLSVKDDLQNLGTGTTFMEISSDAIKNIEVPLPSIKEQRSIAERLDNKIDGMRRASDKLSASIDLLEEYRTSLISNVITGKVEV